MRTMRSPTTKIILAVIAAVAALAVLRYQPWERKTEAEVRNRETLTVGFLPVT